MRIDFSITGIILAGGSGERIGCNKAFLKLGSKTLIEELISRLEERFPRLIIVANETEKYRKFHHEVISDILPHKGPLGGIYTGLVNSNSLYNFIVACDMPFIKPDLIRYMMEKIEVNDVIIPKWNGKFEPLCAIYSKKCIKPIEKQLSKDNLKITDFFKDVNPVRSKLSKTPATPLVWTSNGVKVKVITEKEVAKFDLKGFSFVNINTPEDCRKFKLCMDLKWKSV